ncbi:hypothetical protein EMCRGX_G012250 [Ephydatia muelleri]
MTVPFRLSSAGQVMLEVMTSPLILVCSNVRLHVYIVVGSICHVQRRDPSHATSIPDLNIRVICCDVTVMFQGPGQTTPTDDDMPNMSCVCWTGCTPIPGGPYPWWTPIPGGPYPWWTPIPGGPLSLVDPYPWWTLLLVDPYPWWTLSLVDPIPGGPYPWWTLSLVALFAP